ncbi:BRCT domain-containing protein [bacterium]|nr:BRCT domain-containing protein [bacterium]
MGIKEFFSAKPPKKQPKPPIPLDDQNQPPAQINAARVGDRTADELLGICKGLMADGVINQQEALYLKTWLTSNREYTDSWVVRRIDSRVSQMLEDGKLDSSESKELFRLLGQITGEQSITESVASFTTSLPIDNPPPMIEYPGKIFCLTGNFAYATRPFCEQEILDRGGETKNTISKKVNYLVVGCIGSRDWIHSTYGRKIEKVIQLKESGCRIAVVCEDYWVDSLTDYLPK